jgi:hypothetical protein
VQRPLGTRDCMAVAHFDLFLVLSVVCLTYLRTHGPCARTTEPRQEAPFSKSLAPYVKRCCSHDVTQALQVSVDKLSLISYNIYYVLCVSSQVLALWNSLFVSRSRSPTSMLVYRRVEILTGSNTQESSPVQCNYQ